jgi:hypothetical protein
MEKGLIKLIQFYNILKNMSLEEFKQIYDEIKKDDIKNIDKML